MTFLQTATATAKTMLQFFRISECLPHLTRLPWIRPVQMPASKVLRFLIHSLVTILQNLTGSITMITSLIQIQTSAGRKHWTTVKNLALEQGNTSLSKCNGGESFAFVKAFHLSNFRPANRWKQFVNMQVEHFIQMEYTLSALSLSPGHTLKKKRKEQKKATCIQQAAFFYDYGNICLLNRADQAEAFSGPSIIKIAFTPISLN